MRLRSPTATTLMGEKRGGPWSMITSPSEPANELSGVIRLPLTATPSAPAANRRLTRSCASWNVTR